MGGSTVSAGAGAPRSVAATSLWRAKWAILAVIVLAFVVGYRYSENQPVTYTAQSRIVLSAAQPFDPLGTYSYNDPTRYVADQVALIESQAVLQPAAQTLSTGASADQIDGNGLGQDISAEPSSTTSVIVVNATSSVPEKAVARANAVATAYEAYLAAGVQGVVQSAVAATTDLATVELIRAKAAVYGDGVLTVEPAVDGSAWSSLAPMRSALLITAVAALIAIGLALLWRTPPPDGSAVVRAARTRVLGRVGGRSRLRGAQPQEYALPMVALDYARQGTPGPVLLTGSSARSGTAAVAYGLAASAAIQGRRVLLVDADPDRRELLRASSAAPVRSLEELGSPGISRDEVLVRVPTSGGTELYVAKVGADKSAVLDGAAVSRALGELDGSFDLVLVQSGPVPKSPVAFALLQEVGAVVLVARGRDTARSVTELRDRLDAARRPLIGLVLADRRRATFRGQDESQPSDLPAPAPPPQADAQPHQPVLPMTAPVQLPQQPPPSEQRSQQMGAPTH